MYLYKEQITNGTHKEYINLIQKIYLGIIFIKISVPQNIDYNLVSMLCDIP